MTRAYLIHINSILTHNNQRRDLHILTDNIDWIEPSNKFLRDEGFTDIDIFNLSEVISVDAVPAGRLVFEGDPLNYLRILIDSSTEDANMFELVEEWYNRMEEYLVALSTCY
jgi:hypothetical protein